MPLTYSTAYHMPFTIIDVACNFWPDAYITHARLTSLALLDMLTSRLPTL